MTQDNDSTKSTPIDKDTIDKAIGVLEKITSIDNNEFKKRSGKDRRQNQLLPYFRSFVIKMLENLCSAKMLIFFIPLWTSIFFLWYLFGISDDFAKFIIDNPTAAPELNRFFEIAVNGFISWCTFTVSLGGTVIVVRETFKVNKLKALNSGMPETNDEISAMKE